jgi:prepilin-type N-terminal cleavage/methylation domain-containing protein
VNRRGFSIIELMIVITVFGILVNLALPAVQHMRRRAEAVRVIGDFHAIRIAAYDRYTADGTFPPTDSWGAVPARLVAGLPHGFRFNYGKLEYRWHTWKAKRSDKDDKGKDKGKDDKGKDDKGKDKDDDDEKNPGQALAGLDIRGSKDRKLMAAIRAAYRGPIIFNSSTEFTLIVE